MFGLRDTDKGFSLAFRVTETYKIHLRGQVGGGVGVPVGRVPNSRPRTGRD